MVPCHHICKISFLLSALCLHLQNLIFIWCLVGKFTESHKYKAPTSFLHGALWSHSQNLIKYKAPTRHFLVPCTRRKPNTRFKLKHPYASACVVWFHYTGSLLYLLIVLYWVLKYILTYVIPM